MATDKLTQYGTSCWHTDDTNKRGIFHRDDLLCCTTYTPSEFTFESCHIEYDCSEDHSCSEFLKCDEEDPVYWCTDIDITYQDINCEDIVICGHTPLTSNCMR